MNSGTHLKRMFKGKKGKSRTNCKSHKNSQSCFATILQRDGKKRDIK